jgi:hypothetical protein
VSAPLRSMREIRRRLLAQPGITALPVCPWCGKQVPAKAWGREACQACESERTEASAYFQAQLDATLADEQSAPTEPMFDHDDGRPFPEAD